MLISPLRYLNIPLEAWHSAVENSALTPSTIYGIPYLSNVSEKYSPNFFFLSNTAISEYLTPLSWSAFILPAIKSHSCSISSNSRYIVSPSSYLNFAPDTMFLLKRRLLLIITLCAISTIASELR